MLIKEDRYESMNLPHSKTFGKKENLAITIFLTKEVQKKDMKNK